jgi:thiol-disulfide isomerase/thioredoxin
MDRAIFALNTCVMGGVIVLAAALAAAAVIGVIYRRGQGRMRPGRGARSGSLEDSVLTEADLGVPLGERATLVQFSTAFCAQCRPTRQVLAQVAGQLDGVSVVEIDAASRLDLARRLRVYTTPTVLVLGPDGAVARRTAGQPRKADVIAAVGAALEGSAVEGGALKGSAVKGTAVKGTAVEGSAVELPSI